jgi:hypothetical protein
MHALLFLLAMLLFFPACSTEIKKINSIVEAKEELLKADKQTLVVFDIDQTLVDLAIKAGQARYKNNKLFQKYSAMLQQYIQDKQTKTPNYHEIFESKLWLNIPPQLIELETLNIIKDLQSRGIKIIALTAIHAGKLGLINSMAKNRYEYLKKVGIDFSSSFPEQSIELKNFMSQRVTYPAYYKGIICAATWTEHKNSKGQALATFIEAIKWTPKKVLFFDDSRKNVESVVSEMKKRDIPCLGFLYRAAFIPAKEDLDENILKFQFDYLKKYDEPIGDAEAIIKMKGKGL